MEKYFCLFLTILFANVAFSAPEYDDNNNKQYFLAPQELTKNQPPSNIQIPFISSPKKQNSKKSNSNKTTVINNTKINNKPKKIKTNKQTKNTKDNHISQTETIQNILPNKELEQFSNYQPQLQTQPKLFDDNILYQEHDELFRLSKIAVAADKLCTNSTTHFLPRKSSN